MDIHALRAMLQMLLAQYPTAADWRKDQLNLSIPQLRNIIGDIESELKNIGTD